ncbi:MULTISPECIES: putative 2OG-Fe(II) oxygenase [Methylosinus]|nr:MULTISPECIES: putative 2OG-Fe(II) oxygenase [Methylosinus]OBS52150.1 hypothetical protein A8B73_12615 [Methylosinus sp. 3S-1]
MTATTIRLETAKRLTARQELELTRAAHARNAASRELRRRLAWLLNACDRYSETVALLAGAADLDFGEAMLRTNALLALETHEATREAIVSADCAFALADADRRRAAALADRGKAEMRLGDVRAERTLREALALDPHNKDACKRLAALCFSTREPGAALALAEALVAQGVGHSRVLAAQVLALARLGRIEEAREAEARERLQLVSRLSPPPGWASRQAFDAALAAELVAHPGLHLERYGSASHRTWRIDSTISHFAPLAQQLLARIATIAERHVATLAAAVDHAMIRVRPPELVLHSWCVITDEDGYETWHVHQHGWLSGVYYVATPPGIAEARDERGHIAFGLPEDLVGEEAARAFGSGLVRPEPGLMMLFPAHCYHRTYPHRASGRRICVAFDFRPA